MKTEKIYRFRLLVVLACIAFPLFLMSCASITMQRVAIDRIEAGAFLTALDKEYSALAGRQRNALDIKDYRHFAAKAAAARNGEFIAPDTPRSRHINTDNFPAIWAAHRRLSELPRHVFTAFPKDTAAAHAMYDCWLEELEEQNQSYKTGSCERRWKEIIVNLECTEGRCGINDGFETGPEPFKSYTILFDANDKTPRPDSEKIIDEIANEIAAGNIASVKITGYTDRTGSSDYNKALARTRAGHVADMLAHKGVSRSLVTVEAKGEKGGAIVTDDDVRMDLNRRVEIDLFQ